MYIRLIAGMPYSGKSLYAKDWIRSDFNTILFENPNTNNDLNKIEIAIENNKNIIVIHNDFCNPLIYCNAYKWFVKRIQRKSYDLQCYHIYMDMKKIRSVIDDKIKKGEKIDPEKEKLIEKYKNLYYPPSFSRGLYPYIDK